MYQGAVTPVDSVGTTGTMVDQRSMFKAAQKGVVNGQSALRSMVSADNGRSQCGMVGHLCKNTSLQLVT